MNRFVYEFAEIRDKVTKCLEYEEITPNFYLNAYSVAKVIQQKYEYKLNSREDIRQMFSELGINFNFQVCVNYYLLAKKEQKFREAGGIYSDEMYSKETLKMIYSGLNLNFEQCESVDSCTIEDREDGVQIFIRIYWRSEEWGELKKSNNLLICCFYAVAIFFLYSERIEEGEQIKAKYQKKSYNGDERKAVIVTWFLLYIKYDYDYRAYRYDSWGEYSPENPKEFGDQHPKFYNPYVSEHYRRIIAGKFNSGICQEFERFEWFERYI